MIILIRGHIRNGFDTDELYNCLHRLHSINPITIYIHTWDIKQNSISWRPIADDSTVITHEIIHAYFRDLAPLIKHIRIDPDRSLPLIGEIDGCVTSSHIPKIGWKSMWAGIHTMLQHISAEQKPSELIVNTRFDLFTNSNNFPQDLLVRFYSIATLVANAPPSKLWFLSSTPFNGCDNFYIGTLERMTTLANIFYTELDRINEENYTIINPERLVMIEAARIK